MMEDKDDLKNILNKLEGQLYADIDIQQSVLNKIEKQQEINQHIKKYKRYAKLGMLSTICVIVFTLLLSNSFKSQQLYEFNSISLSLIFLPLVILFIQKELGAFKLIVTSKNKSI